jgi:hypothetical protein
MLSIKWVRLRLRGLAGARGKGEGFAVDANHGLDKGETAGNRMQR